AYTVFPPSYDGDHSA
ncbi:hypothetical protein KIPB_011802, partial [Kipferlia bialata]